MSHGSWCSLLLPLRPTGTVPYISVLWQWHHNRPRFILARPTVCGFTTGHRAQVLHQGGVRADLWNFLPEVADKTSSHTLRVIPPSPNPSLRQTTAAGCHAPNRAGLHCLLFHSVTHIIIFHLSPFFTWSSITLTLPHHHSTLGFPYTARLTSIAHPHNPERYSRLSRFCQFLANIQPSCRKTGVLKVVPHKSGNFSRMAASLKEVFPAGDVWDCQVVLACTGPGAWPAKPGPAGAEAGPGHLLPRGAGPRAGPALQDQGQGYLWAGGLRPGGGHASVWTG